MKRRSMRQRERFQFPAPTHTWKKNGCLIEVFVVRSGFSVFGRLEVLFRIGTVKLYQGQPGFSSFFSAKQAATLLELMDEVESWHDVFSTLRIRDTIPVKKWREKCSAIRPISTIGSSVVGGSDRVESRVCKLDSAISRAVYSVVATRLVSERRHVSFFHRFDLPDVEEQLWAIVEDHRIRVENLMN